jgi:hypothetical protein
MDPNRARPDANDVAKFFWDVASVGFAESARGVVNAFVPCSLVANIIAANPVGEPPKCKTMWALELPIVMAKLGGGGVTSLNVHYFSPNFPGGGAAAFATENRLPHKLRGEKQNSIGKAGWKPKLFWNPQCDRAQENPARFRDWSLPSSTVYKDRFLRRRTEPQIPQMVRDLVNTTSLGCAELLPGCAITRRMLSILNGTNQFAGKDPFEIAWEQMSYK